VVLPLGFNAVILAGIAHRTKCDQLPHRLPHAAISIPAAGVHRAERCPRECSRCHPPFETLLTYQLERSVETLTS
jgi:hypothetical protein